MDENLKSVWRQGETPVVYRPGKSQPLMVKLPYAPGNREWLRDEHLRKPEWDEQHTCWLVPVAWFDELIRRLLRRFNETYVIQLHREKEICAPACWQARGLHCECSCMGANHGKEVPGGNWFVVSDACAVEWGPKKLACRLLKSRPDWHGPRL